MQDNLVVVIRVSPAPSRRTLDLDQAVYNYGVESVRLTAQLGVYTADPVIV